MAPAVVASPGDPVTAAPSRADRRAELHGSAWQVAARVASVGLQGAAFALVARLLGPTALGGFAGAFALASLVGAASEFGLQNTTVVELGRARPGDRPAIIAHALVASALLGLVGIVLAAPLGVLAFDGGATVAFVALVPWAVISRLAVAGAAWFQSRLDFRRLFVIEVVGRGIPVAGLAVLVAIGPAWTTTELVVAAGSVLAAGATVQVAAACPRPLWAALRTTTDRLGGTLLMARLAAPLGLVAAISLVHVRADQVILELLGHGGAELGRYSVAYRVVEGAAGVLGAVATVGFSAMSRAVSVARRGVGRLYAGVVPAVAAAGGIVVVVGAPALVAVVGGPGFGGAVALTRLIAVIVVVSVVNMVPSLTIVAERQTRRLVPVGIAMVACNIALNLALVPVVGATGSAVATIVTEVTGLALVTRLAEQALPGSQRPTSSVLAVAAVALAGGATAAAGPLAWALALAAGAAVLGLAAGVRSALAPEPEVTA